MRLRSAHQTPHEAKPPPPQSSGSDVTTAPHSAFTGLTATSPFHRKLRPARGKRRRRRRGERGRRSEHHKHTHTQDKGDEA